MTHYQLEYVINDHCDSLNNYDIVFDAQTIGCMYAQNMQILKLSISTLILIYIHTLKLLDIHALCIMLGRDSPQTADGYVCSSCQGNGVSCQHESGTQRLGSQELHVS